MLDILLSVDSDKEEKKFKLKNEFDIPMTEQEIDDMCNPDSVYHAVRFKSLIDSKDDALTALIHLEYLR